MDPGLLNNLYLVGGLLAAIFVIVRRLTSASQKAVVQSIEQSIAYLQLQITGLKDDTQEVKDRLEKVEDRLERGLTKVDDRVRSLQMDMAVVKDRLNIRTDNEPASPVPARAGLSVPKATAAEA